MESLCSGAVLVLLIRLIVVSCSKITGAQYAALPSLFHQDNYDECMLFENQALYCSLTYALEPIHATSVPEIWRVIKEVSSDPFNYRHDVLRHGICVTTACPNVVTNTDREYLNVTLTQCYNQKYREVGLKGVITDLECSTNEPKYPMDWIDATIGILTVCYVGLIIVATFWKSSNKTWTDKIFTAFSLTENWKKLTKIENTPEMEKLCVIQLIRVISTFLVILTHNAAFMGMIPVANVKWVENVTNYPILALVAGGASSFDSLYMMISTFLLFYGYLEYTKNLKKLPITILLIVFLNRAVRLSPLIAVVLFHASWYRHMGDGPYWDHFVGGEYLRCRKNGWTNIVFLNSYVPFKEECLHTTWHTSTEMQYLIVLLPLMYYIRKHPRHFWWILGTLIPLQMIATFCQNYLYGFPTHQFLYPEAVFDLNMSLNSKQFRHQHTSLIGNFAGPLVGLILGWVYYDYRDKRFFTKKVYVIIWWIGALLATAFMGIPGVFKCLQIEESTFWSSMYTAFSRVVLCTGVAMVIFAFSQGVAWSCVKKCALLPTIYVAGRLAYSVFLVHYPLIYLRISMSRFPYYFNGSLMVFEVLGNIFLSYLFGVLFSLLFEAPIYRLSRLVLQNSIREKEKQKSR